MLGDLGPPEQQHAAASATQIMAGALGAEPVFLRIPGVAPSAEIREALLSRDTYARHALSLLDHIDVALVDIGTCSVNPPERPSDNYFTEEQLRHVRDQGAVGHVCLRYLDADGELVASPLDDLITGVTPEQIRKAGSRWAVAGGPSKYRAIRAALRGGWVDTLVTDAATANLLVKTESTAYEPASTHEA